MVKKPQNSSKNEEKSTSKKIPTIRQILLYTWEIRKNRVQNALRDEVPKHIKVAHVTQYKKTKHGTFSYPEKNIAIYTSSYPQYDPYLRYKQKKSAHQHQIKHSYHTAIQIYLDPSGHLSLDSPIIWRVGSYKRYSKPSQSLIKSIYKETEAALVRRSLALPMTPSQRKKWVQVQKSRIRESAPYLNPGDYAARALGINLDSYYRIYPLQIKYHCLFGPHTQSIQSKKPEDKDIQYPFFDKHMVSVIFYLLKKKILLIK